MNPTNDTYKTLNLAYEFFNKELFDGKLPGCLITMQRKGKALGYFCAEQFETRKEEKFSVHEISLNPSHFKDRTDEQIISTLVHEMAHLWQQEFGNPPRRGYHDKEWGEKMRDIGLIPSNTGAEGGKPVGQSMSHYIEEGGRYERLISVFLASHQLEYQDRPAADALKAKKKNKVKYVCPECEMKAWGKPGISLICGDCEVKLEEQGT